jgi:hypothetical protein
MSDTFQRATDDQKMTDTMKDFLRIFCREDGVGGVGKRGLLASFLRLYYLKYDSDRKNIAQ